MRVIAGEFRSRRLKSSPGRATRPTPDRLRETLFDILGSRVGGAVFLDAYAGTGAVGIEAISRGAARGIFIERSKAAEKVLRENVVSLGIEDRTVVELGAAAALIPRYKAGIVFLDPPYDHESEYGRVFEILGEIPPELVIAQHSVRFELPDSCGALRRTRVVKQGDNSLSFYAALRAAC